jgi:hypothetical protein
LWMQTPHSRYYSRFPGDVEQIGKVVKYIHAKGGRIPLPGGGMLTPQGLQWLGINLGFAGGIESLHCKPRPPTASLHA